MVVQIGLKRFYNSKNTKIKNNEITFRVQVNQIFKNLKIFQIIIFQINEIS